MIQTIDGIQFKRMVLHGSAAIALQKQQINDLNVFPVPDGDTGTNMSLTIGTAAAELKKSDPNSLIMERQTAVMLMPCSTMMCRRMETVESSL